MGIYCLRRDHTVPCALATIVAAFWPLIANRRKMRVDVVINYKRRAIVNLLVV